jgi:spore germination protein GerM
VKTSRAFLLVVLLVLVGAASWYWARHRLQSTRLDHVTVYYTKADGKSEAAWTLSMRPAQPGESASEHLRNTVLYAATQAVAGPASDVAAIRFPAGTHVRSADVTGSTAHVDLSAQVKDQTSGIAGETGEFKALVWTLTAIPGIDAVAVTVEGQTLSTLPGGHLELDEPLHRSDF